MTPTPVRSNGQSDDADGRRFSTRGDADVPVVDDSEGEEQDAQRRRDAFSQQREDPDGERDVGRGGNPGAARRRCAGVEQEVDARRNEHAAQRGDRGQGGAPELAELARVQLALDLEPERRRTPPSDRRSPRNGGRARSRVPRGATRWACRTGDHTSGATASWPGPAPPARPPAAGFRSPLRPTETARPARSGAGRPRARLARCRAAAGGRSEASFPEGRTKQAHPGWRPDHPVTCGELAAPLGSKMPSGDGAVKSGDRR